MGQLLKQRILDQATVGAVRFKQHLEGTLDIKEALLIGHLGGGDILSDVVAVAILPEHNSFRVPRKAVAPHFDQVTRLQVLAGFQIHVRLGVDS